jgi:hypothetical protein
VGLGVVTKINAQPLEIDMPRTCGSQVNGKIRPTGAENTSPAGDRLADSEKVREDTLRRGIQADTLRDIVFHGREKSQQAVWLESYVAGLVEDAMHDPAEMTGRDLNTDGEGVDMHEWHSIARRDENTFVTFSTNTLWPARP